MRKHFCVDWPSTSLWVQVWKTHLFASFSSFFSYFAFFMQKKLEKAYFNQCLVYAAPESWLKYTTVIWAEANFVEAHLFFKCEHLGNNNSPFYFSFITFQSVPLVTVASELHLKKGRHNIYFTLRKKITPYILHSFFCLSLSDPSLLCGCTLTWTGG